jgi:mannosidase alpha-like ER degradation enhancer 1
MDSFYEYLLKSYIMFQEETDITMFKELYSSVRQFMRRGRPDCLGGDGPHPLYVNVDMTNGDTATNWVDSLQAAFPGVQVNSKNFDYFTK